MPAPVSNKIRDKNAPDKGKLSSKGQVTVPKKIREFLKADPRDVLLFTPVSKGKVMVRVQKSRSAKELFGMLGKYAPKTPVSVEDMDKAIAQGIVEEFK